MPGNNFEENIYTKNLELMVTIWTRILLIENKGDVWSELVIN